MATSLAHYFGRSIHSLTYSSHWCTINIHKSMIGVCATSSDHIVIYGVGLDYDHELKMQSRPEPVHRLVGRNQNVRSTNTTKGGMVGFQLGSGSRLYKIFCRLYNIYYTSLIVIYISREIYRYIDI